MKKALRRLFPFCAGTAPGRSSFFVLLLSPEDGSADCAFVLGPCDTKNTRNPWFPKRVPRVAASSAPLTPPTAGRVRTAADIQSRVRAEQSAGRDHSCRMASSAEILTARFAGIMPDTTPIAVEKRSPSSASQTGITDILEPYIGSIITTV